MSPRVTKNPVDAKPHDASHVYSACVLHPHDACAFDQRVRYAPCGEVFVWSNRDVALGWCVGDFAFTVILPLFITVELENSARRMFADEFALRSIWRRGEDEGVPAD